MNSLKYIPHGGDVNDLEVIDIDGAVHVDVLADFVQDGEKSDVGFTGAGRSAKQQILVRLERRFIQARLNAVQLLETLEGRLSPFGQVADRNEGLVLLKGLGLQRWDVDLFVA